MTRLLRAGAVVLLAVTVVAAGPPSAGFSADRFKAHVTFVADDALEGREAGTRGHEIAARYIASQFALLGVKPAGSDGTYYQKSRLPRIRGDRRGANHRGRRHPPERVMRPQQRTRTLAHGPLRTAR